MEPIAFKDDVTVKIDGGGIAFSLDAMHRQQCVALWAEEPNELSASDRDAQSGRSSGELQRTGRL